MYIFLRKKVPTKKKQKQAEPKEIVAVAGAKVELDHSAPLNRPRIEPLLIPKFPVRCKYKA